MFSSDIVAFEAQTAPLWESSAKQNDQSSAKKRKSNEQKNISAVRKRRRKPISISKLWSDKRQKITLDFTECKLCELKFKSELLMEEHLFSILHHRALHTKKGECQHVCNLCNVTCRNLSSYVQHLQDDTHRSKVAERKAEIDAGNYPTPRNNLRKYTSTFMSLPTKSKNLRKEKVARKKIKPVFSKDSFSTQSSEFHNKRLLHHSRGKRFKEGLLPTPSVYHAWSDKKADIYQDSMCRYDSYYPQYDWTEDTYCGSFQNPYESGWAEPFSWRPDNRDSYHWRRPDYRCEYRNNFRDKPYKEEYLSSSWGRPESDPNKNQSKFKHHLPRNQGNYSRSFTEGQARTKKLVARAHKVMSNRNTHNVPHNTQKLEENSATKDRPSNLVNGKCKANKLVIDEASYDNSLKQSKRKKHIALPKQSNSINSTKHVEKIVGKGEPDLSSISERNFEKHATRKLKKWRSMKRSISLESKVLPNIYNEFRKQIDKEMAGSSSLASGPVRVNSYDQKNMGRSISEDLQSEVANSGERSDVPLSDIRAKFRQILEDIDGPVASALEILHGIHQDESHLRNEKNSEISETSWTHTTGPLSSTCSYAPTTSIPDSSEENINNLSHSSNKTEHTLNHETTQYTSLPTPATQPKNTSLHSNSLSDVTVENSTTLSTPIRDCETSACENDTPTNKNRLQPQPNVNKARSRLTSKQRDSPDIPSDVKQAKLKKLFLKYDRTKKNSPNTKESFSNKKLTGPRFGIELNLQNDATHSSEMESIAEKIELVEVLPEKRTRSLSESDGFLSFAMESSSNSSQQQQVFESTIQQTQTTKIRTSTPTCSTNPQCDGLNSKLLSMSEREETLHASIRSLAIQEANNQSEIVSKSAVLRTIQTELKKLNERKLCIDALKRRNEEELEVLREERLMLLRGTVSNPSDAKPRSIFQNAPPNSRHMAPSFDKSTPNQNTVTRGPDVLGMFGTICTSNTIRETPSGPNLPDMFGKVSNPSNAKPESNFQNVPPNSRHTTPSFNKSIPNQNTVTRGTDVLGMFGTFCTSNTGRVTPSGQNLPDLYGTIGMSNSGGGTSSFDKSSPNVNTFPGHTQCQNVCDLFGAIGASMDITDKKKASTTTVVTVYPKFDVSKVKSELIEDEDIKVPFVSEFQTQSQPVVNVKKENLSNETTSSEKNLIDKDINISEDSTKFYSFDANEEKISSDNNAEIDNILSKYSNKVGINSTSKNSPRKNPKTPRIGTRRSPRNLNKGPHDTPSPNKNKDDAISTPQKQKTLDASNAMVSGSNEKLPKCIKAHELPLIGMRVLENALITCSLDETIAIHPNGDMLGEKVSERLDATPTAMAAVSTITGTDYVFVSTQKIVTQKISDIDSKVINNMESFVNIFAIHESKRKTPQRNAVFNLTSKIMMKTRVLCMHYDKHLLFCGMRDGMAAIISLNASFTPEEDMTILECHSCSAITCLTTGTEGPRRILCCGSTDCTVSVRDATDGLLLRTIQGHTKTITCVQIVHNELFSASVDRRVLGHDLITGKLLHKFLGHVGVVRAFYVTGERMVTLCSDRNIRFYDSKTCRLLLKPKLLKSLPLYVDVKTIRSDGRVKHTVFVGCEDSTVVRIPFPSNQQLSEEARNSNLSGALNDSIVNLTGDYECKWAGCTEVCTFMYVQTLRKHIFDVHLNVYDLVGNSLDDTAATLTVGTCCQWESCTHYFAPELDTMADIQTHIQDHLMEFHRGKFQEKQGSSKK